MAILEAVTYLLDDGFEPNRTVYLSFGHDEEIGGENGALEVTHYLKERNVQLAWSLDEGSFLLTGVFPGLETMVAAINVAEKGSVTLDIVATGAGGHSSMLPSISGSIQEIRPKAFTPMLKVWLAITMLACAPVVEEARPKSLTGRLRGLR